MLQVGSRYWSELLKVVINGQAFVVDWVLRVTVSK